MNEILGRSRWAPIIFGCQAPDTGNAEIIAHYGTEEQKERYLRPLLDGEIFSSYSMTEPQGGSDPTRFDDPGPARRRRVGHRGMEVLLVQRPDLGLPHRDGRHRPRRERVPGDVDVPRPHRHARASTSCATSASWASTSVTATRGCTPSSTTTRCGSRPRASWAGRARPSPSPRPGSGGGRIHHAMRTVGVCQKALDMMCERALSRHDPGQPPGRQADVCRTTSPTPTSSSPSSGSSCSTWRGRSTSTRTTARSATTSPRSRSSPPQVLHDIVQRSIQVHGALGVSNELPPAGLLDDGAGHGTGRRAERGAPGHRRPPDPEALQGRPRGCGRPSTCPRSSPRHAPSSPSTSSTRWPTNEPRS